METLDLYDLAERAGIRVDYFDLSGLGSCAVALDRQCCAIALDPAMIDTGAEEKTRLAHELGHCLTGAFYTRSSPLAVLGKAEYKADRWSVFRLLPFNQLQYAIRILDIKKPYELAEHFNVTEALIHKAFDVYKRLGLAL